MPRHTLLLLAALTAASVVLYATRLGHAPAYVMHDESQFALQAESIASSGRDLSGHLLPIFFTEPEFPAGRDPVVIYITAAALTWLPFSEASVRLPTALLSVLNVALMFLLARRLFGRDSMALVAAGFLALTPAHFIRGRLLLSPQYSIPFVLAWLLCMAAYAERPRERQLAAAAAWLGLCTYSYLASMMMMPVYLLLTMWVARRTFGIRGAVVTMVAFALPMVPMAVWYATHPERYGQIVDAYRLYGSSTDVPAVSSLSTALATRLGLYWSFFNPDFLFLSGDSSLINSTRLVGFFPLSFAVLMPLGVLRLVRAGGSMAVLVLAGLATAPLAAVVTGAIEMNRILLAVPFGVLTAVHGVDWLIAAHSRVWRAVAVVLIAAVPLQFAGFYQDYMGRYRVEASRWFGGNTREVLIAAVDRLAADPQRRLYVSRAIPFTERYWRFYALTKQRPDLIDRAIYYGPDGPSEAGPASDLVCAAAAAECRALTDGTEWDLVRSVAELDGTPSFVLLEKHRP